MLDALLFPRYFEATIEVGVLAALGTLALTLFALVLTPALAASVSRTIRSPGTRFAAIGVLVALFIYGAAIRPTLEPFSHFHNGSSLDGTRDFREDSLRNLAVYLSWPMVVAALAGICLSIGRFWASRRNPVRPLALVLAVVPALLYLWLPQVSPDHPWAFRRFIPIVVPCTILFAAVVVHAIGARVPRGGALGAVGLALAASFLMFTYPGGNLLFS